MRRGVQLEATGCFGAAAEVPWLAPDGGKGDERDTSWPPARIGCKDLLHNTDRAPLEGMDHGAVDADARMAHDQSMHYHAPSLLDKQPNRYAYKRAARSAICDQHP